MRHDFQPRIISKPGLFPGGILLRSRPSGPFGRFRLRHPLAATTASIAAIFGRIRRIPAGFECLPTPCCRNV